MNAYRWRAEMQLWAESRRDIPPVLRSDIVSFFERAFVNTRCPERAWFGCHPTRASLVVGGIYLAAIHATGGDRWLWLLVDQQPPAIPGLNFRLVKSTARSKHPLLWANSPTLDVLPAVLADSDIWTSFAVASEKVLTSSTVAGDRDAVQLRRGKHKLTDFWRCAEHMLFPDEVDGGDTFREGAKKLVPVNAYERDQVARRRCIEHYGASCFICRLSFGEAYGPTAEGFIHVHHLRPLSEIGEEYAVHPVDDLRPVCPNCHAVLHLRKPPFSIHEVQSFLGLTKGWSRPA